MSLIQIQNLTFQYDTSHENIFEDVSLSLDTDWRLGFVGRNGRGKTTFLNLLLGRYPVSYTHLDVSKRQTCAPSAVKS